MPGNLLTPSPRTRRGSRHKSTPKSAGTSLKDLSKGVPRFYFPEKREDTSKSPEVLKKDEAEIRAAFEDRPGGVPINDFHQIAQELWDCPGYLATLLFRRIVAAPAESKEAERVVTLEMMLKFWRRELAGCDEVERCFRILKGTSNDYLVPSDFAPLLDEIVGCHPGLEFLSSTAEFQEKYAKTVIIRFFYVIDRALNGRISLQELRKSNFLDVLKYLEQEDDINKVHPHITPPHSSLIPSPSLLSHSLPFPYSSHAAHRKKHPFPYTGAGLLFIRAFLRHLLQVLGVGHRPGPDIVAGRFVQI